MASRSVPRRHLGPGSQRVGFVPYGEGACTPPSEDLFTLALAAMAVGTLPLRDSRSSSLPSVYASIGLDGGGRANQGDNDSGDNDDGDPMTAATMTRRTSEDDGNDDRDNDEDDNDNDDEGDDVDDICDIYDQIPESSCPRVARMWAEHRRAVTPPEPSCSTPWQGAVFTSYDSKVALRVFALEPAVGAGRDLPGDQCRNGAVAKAPTARKSAHVRVWASHCDSNPMRFPAEVNLGIRYSDVEATKTKDETRFVIGRLGVDTATWVAVEKGPAARPRTTCRPPSPGSYYMVWEAR